MKRLKRWIARRWFGDELYEAAEDGYYKGWVKGFETAAALVAAIRKAGVAERRNGEPG